MVDIVLMIVVYALFDIAVIGFALLITAFIFTVKFIRRKWKKKLKSLR